MQPALKGAAAMFFQHPRPVSAGYFLQLVGEVNPISKGFHLFWTAMI